MWCGQAPDSTTLAACCAFAWAIVAWAVAALIALALRAGDRNKASVLDMLAIGFIACVLAVAVHMAPPPIAALLALAVAAHALLIAGAVALDALKPAPDSSV